MPKKKTNEQFLSEVSALAGNEFAPQETYRGNNIKIKFYHTKCQQIFEVRPKDFLIKGVRCSICAGNKRLSIEEIKNFVESQSDCELLSNSYQNQNSVLNFKCKCGVEFKTKFLYFKHDNKRHCDECGRKQGNSKMNLDFEYVRKQVENNGYSLVSDEYVNNSTPLTFLCSNGHQFSQTYNDFQGGHRCKKCAHERNANRCRKDFDTIKTDINVDGYKLVSNSYRNTKDKLSIVCPRNHTFEMCYSDFHHLKHRCPKCYQINVRENATSQVFGYLRNYIGDWKNSSMRECGFKCVLTGGKFDAIHHVYSFNLIAKEAFANLGVVFKPTVSAYSVEELSEIISEVQRLHTVYGNGVCLRKDVHNLYHSIYGFTNNADQFAEFKARWLNGEFKEVI